jgi:hypothetical protein
MVALDLGLCQLGYGIVKIKFYKIMVLVCSPVDFLLLCNTSPLLGICIGMFSITLNDMFRPAMFVLATYAKPENRTRALTLVD